MTFDIIQPEYSFAKAPIPNNSIEILT